MTNGLRFTINSMNVLRGAHLCHLLSSHGRFLSICLVPINIVGVSVCSPSSGYTVLFSIFVSKKDDE